MDKQPYIEKDLIEWLEQAYPERCPNINDPERAIWLYAGRREMVKVLRAIYQTQEEESLNV
jgi:hypothetical protein